MHTAVHWHNFSLKTGGDQWRLQDLLSGGHDDRGTEGVIIEAPSAVGYGEGCRKLPQRGPEQSPGRYRTFKSGGDKSPSSHTKLRLCNCASVNWRFLQSVQRFQFSIRQGLQLFTDFHSAFSQ